MVPHLATASTTSSPENTLPLTIHVNILSEPPHPPDLEHPDTPSGLSFNITAPTSHARTIFNACPTPLTSRCICLGKMPASAQSRVLLSPYTMLGRPKKNSPFPPRLALHRHPSVILFSSQSHFCGFQMKCFPHHFEHLDPSPQRVAPPSSQHTAHHQPTGLPARDPLATLVPTH